MELSWHFFQVDRLPRFISADRDPVDDMEHTHSSAEAFDSSGSSASFDSSASSSADDVSPVQFQKKRCISHTTVDPKDRAFGLPRHTWHIMLPLQDAHETAPVWDDKSWKTACGRFFSSTTICICSEFRISEEQVICSHAGCRKFFTRMDA